MSDTEKENECLVCGVKIISGTRCVDCYINKRMVKKKEEAEGNKLDVDTSGHSFYPFATTGVATLSTGSAASGCVITDYNSVPTATITSVDSTAPNGQIIRRYKVNA